MDEYNEYGEYQGEFSDGFEISEDPLGNLPDENDAAAQYLAGNSVDGEEPSSPSELYGAMVAADLQLLRIDGVSYGTQAGLKELLSGNQIPGVSSIDAAAAVEEFASVIEMNPKEFAKRIKIDKAVTPSKNPQDIKAMLSMLQNTSGEYLERGPGKTLPGNIFDADKQAKADEDLARASVLLESISDKYIHSNTRGTRAEEPLREAVKHEISTRLLEGAFWDGSKAIAPLPNELNTLGLVPTQGIYSSGQGTPYDRLTGSVFDDLYQKEDGRFVRDERGWKVFKESVSEEERVEALRSIPSLNNSLFPKPRPRGKGEIPFTKEEKEHQARTQKFLGDTFQHEVEELRKILVKEAPTTYDETVGQGNRSGFARPRDEQDATQNLLNEAAILDIERDSSVDGDKVGVTHKSTGEIDGQQAFSTREGRGSDRDGMYSATQLSDRDIFLEKAREGKVEAEVEELDPEARRVALKDVTDLEIELAKIESLNRPSQDTEEKAWLKLRENKITASTASILSKENGVEETALRLASERLGHGKKWAGNAHTVDGKRGEKLAVSKFLSGPGKGLTMTEGFFEEGEGELEGFGVSPDGRLYNEEGKSEGLLEVKFLSSSTVEDALNTYHDQMQMQMLVTGEEQVHFYALDKHKRDGYHKVVKADPKIQAKLKKAGLAALEIANPLDQRGLQALRDTLEFKGLGSNTPPPNKGQTTSFKKPEDESIEAATTFDPNMVGPPPKSSSLDNRPRSREDIEGLEDIEEAISEGMGEGQFKKLKESQGEKRARREEEAAAKEAAESIRELGNAAEGAARLLTEVGKIVTGGNEDAIDIMSKSKKAGFDSVENYVGVRRELVRGLVPEAKVDSVIQNAADRNILFSDAGSAVAEQLRLESMKGQAIDLPSILNMDLASINQNMAMTVQERIAYQAEVIQSQPEGKARAYAASMFNAGDMAGIKVDPISIEEAYAENVINEERQYETLQGGQTIEELRKEATWTLGEVGETGGAIAKGLGVAAGAAMMYGPSKKLVKSVFGKGGPKSGNALKGARSMLQKTSGKVSSISKVAGGKVLPIVAGAGSAAATGSVVAGSRAAAAVKTLGSVASANPVAAASTIVPAAVRAAAGIEDDDSLSDSAMDVLEFTAWGAAAGSVIPGVGTLVGAGVGLAAGLTNEAFEYFSEPDPVPDNKLGPINNISDPKAMPTPVINNIEVNTSVSKDGVSTEVTENGDQIYLEEGAANGFSN